MSGRRPGAALTPVWDNGDVPEYRDVRREADGTAGRPYETRRPRGRHLKNRLHSAHGQRRRRRARRAALHQLPGVRRDRQRQPTTSSKIAPDVDVPRASLTKRSRSPWKRLGSTAGTSRPPSVVFPSGGVHQKSGDAAISAPGRSARRSAPAARGGCSDGRRGIYRARRSTRKRRESRRCSTTRTRAVTTSRSAAPPTTRNASETHPMRFFQTPTHACEHAETTGNTVTRRRRRGAATPCRPRTTTPPLRRSAGSSRKRRTSRNESR